MSKVNNSPAYDAFINLPVSPLARRTGVLLGFLVIAAILWMIIAPIDIIAGAQGSIIPLGKSKEIQAPAAGVVSEILVRNGQRVEAGDILVRLDPTEHEARQLVISQQLEAAHFDAHRFRSLLSPDPVVTFKSRVKPDHPLYDQYLQLVDDESDAYRHQQEGLSHQQHEIAAELTRARTTLDMLVEVEPLLIEQFEAQQTLLDKGYTSKPQYLTAKQKLIEIKNERISQHHHIRQIEASRARLGAKSAELKSTFRTKASEKLIDARDHIDQYQQELRQARQQYAYSTITAPIAGIIHELKVSVIGAVIQPAEKILTIVPAGTDLEIEAFILNKDIGFVRPGQTVNIKVATFPFTKYGSLTGHVISVSQDALETGFTSAPEGDAVNTREMANRMAQATPGTLYKARIAIDDSTIMVINGQDIQLTPGMAVTINIKTGKRTVMDFLLSTMWRYADEGLTER